jgi:phosphosulfolactate synthase (CoM biosynthesis protein A)
MNIAFEITPEDVGLVCAAHRLHVNHDELFEKLDHDRIEKAALYGNDIETQSDYAYQNIEEQLKELGYLGFNALGKYPTA